MQIPDNNTNIYKVDLKDLKNAIRYLDSDEGIYSVLKYTILTR